MCLEQFCSGIVQEVPRRGHRELPNELKPALSTRSARKHPRQLFLLGRADGNRFAERDRSGIERCDHGK